VQSKPYERLLVPAVAAAPWLVLLAVGCIPGKRTLQSDNGLAEAEVRRAGDVDAPDGTGADLETGAAGTSDAEEEEVPDIPGMVELDAERPQDVGDAADDWDDSFLDADAPGAVTDVSDVCVCDFVCGNKVCELGESAVVDPSGKLLHCPVDCGWCGDEICSFNLLETADNCPPDCSPAICGDGVCSIGETADKEKFNACLADCGVCGDGVCGFPDLLNPAFAGCKEWDCSSTCGDGMCNKGESTDSCPVDCAFCGDGYCSLFNNVIENCPQDCSKPCGDGTCSNGETTLECPVDCGWCGDGVCGIMEINAGSCLWDCPFGCGDGHCNQPYEQPETCPVDCDCIPKCDPEWECGLDETCGEECGKCGPDAECIEHKCCFKCEEKQCGDNGCGEDCGQCAAGDLVCHKNICCTPSCVGKECGGDGCGGQCPGCAEGQVCANHKCCGPDCADKECGDSGCGTSCGQCAPEFDCQEGKCVLGSGA